MPNKDRHGRPIIVAADWFGKLPSTPRKLKPGAQPPQSKDDPIPNEVAAEASSDKLEKPRP